MMALLAREIEEAGGVLDFQRYMELALYAPGLGYYVAGAAKLGPAGDFVTAPEISPLFGRALAQPGAQVMAALGDEADILEFGAGSGRMAAQILAGLEALGRLPRRYLILEPSPDLQQRQGRTLAEQVPHLAHKVSWLSRMPEGFRGLMVANEVLDAMPVACFRKRNGGTQALGVTLEGGRLRPRWRPADDRLALAVHTIEREVGPLEEGYRSEVNLQLRPWLSALAQSLEQGVILLIDYGHERSAYYHPQRHMGTLRCHYRHQVVDDPLCLPGLMDITAHVDFSAVADAATWAGLTLLGYDNQANFLLGCGIDRLMEAADEDPLSLAQGLKRLLLPNAMGESFKALALGKGWSEPLVGFG